MSDLLSIVRHLYAADIYYLTPRLLAGIFDLDTPQTYALVERLTRQELVTPVEKGKYMLVVLEPERVLGTPLFMGASAGQSGRRSARKPDSDKSGVYLSWSNEAWRAVLGRVEADWERDLRHAFALVHRLRHSQKADGGGDFLPARVSGWFRRRQIAVESPRRSLSQNRRSPTPIRQPPVPG